MDYNPSSISFALIDVNGTEGFPGTVVTTVRMQVCEMNSNAEGIGIGDLLAEQ